MRKLLLLFLITIAVLGDTSAQGFENDLPPCVKKCRNFSFALHKPNFANPIPENMCRMHQDYGVCVGNTCNNSTYTQVLRNRFHQLSWIEGWNCVFNF